MQIDFAKSENIGLPVGAIGEILHDLCQPLTALECSLELAMLRGSVVEMRSLTSVALDAARRLHILANQAQAIEVLCRQFRHPRVVSLSDIATAFSLAYSNGPAGKIYVDPAGLGAAFHRIAGSGPLRGRITGNSDAVKFILDVALMQHDINANHADPAAVASATGDELASHASLTSALVEHLGGRVSFSPNAATLEFRIH